MNKQENKRPGQGEGYVLSNPLPPKPRKNIDDIHHCCGHVTERCWLGGKSGQAIKAKLEAQPCFECMVKILNGGSTDD